MEKGNYGCWRNFRENSVNFTREFREFYASCNCNRLIYK